jgi:hypothetical protein
MLPRTQSYNSQQSDLMLNVSHQEDELESPKLGYRDGKLVSRTTSDDSRSARLVPEVPETLDAHALQHVVDATEWPTPSFDHQMMSSPQRGEEVEVAASHSLDCVKDSFEPPPPAKEDAQSSEHEEQSPLQRDSPQLARTITADHEEDDEDLYGVSPATKAKTKAAAVAKGNTSAQVRVALRPTKIIANDSEGRPRQ